MLKYWLDCLILVGFIKSLISYKIYLENNPKIPAQQHSKRVIDNNFNGKIASLKF